MNMKPFLLLLLNVFIIPSLAASAAPKEAPSLGSKDWLKWAIESMAQKPQATTATAAAPANSQANQKNAAEDLIRKKVVFKLANRASGYNRCCCEFVTTVDYAHTNDETVEDFYKQKIPLALWLVLERQIQTGIQCTKTFMYQAPDMFPNKGVIHFQPVPKKCKKTAPNLNPKEFEIEVRQTYAHIPVPSLPPTPATTAATTFYNPGSEITSLRNENETLKNTVKELLEQLAALSQKHK